MLLSGALKLTKVALPSFAVVFQICVPNQQYSLPKLGRLNYLTSKCFLLYMNDSVKFQSNKACMPYHLQPALQSSRITSVLYLYILSEFYN